MSPAHSHGAVFGRSDLKTLLSEGALLAAGPFAAALYGAARFGAGSPQSRTLAFSSLVTAQLLHAISCRSTRQGIFGPGELQPNPYLTKTLIASTAAQGLALLIPRLRTLMGVAPLDPASIVVAAAAGITPFVIRELGKLRNAPSVTRPATPARNDGTPAVRRTHCSEGRFLTAT